MENLSSLRSESKYYASEMTESPVIARVVREGYAGLKSGTYKGNGDHGKGNCDGRGNGRF